ncbi:MAG: DNA recombination protein RmuC [Planctomycetes bacterium]|nr:DNA recombination protein RmuC [Planctomycetota bacterium]
MSQILLAVGIVLVLAVLALLTWLITCTLAAQREIAGQAAGIGLLQQQLEALKAAQDRTSQTLQSSLQTGQSALAQNLQANQQTLHQLHRQIGELQGTNRQMLQLGSEVRRLQDILSSPKLRGQIGEWSLENLLAQALPKGSYSLQHAFKDGRIVDALVQMTNFTVGIDAKFPLPSFERIAACTGDDEKPKLRRQFARDVASHVDKIASAYIQPTEGTLDFALMYIPAENIYYETIIHCDGDGEDILRHCLERKVIPVSPNLLYVYLMTVAMGLHGLQIEQKAAEIRQNLCKLNGSFAEFTCAWDTLGTHLRNAYTKYDEAQKRLDRLGLQLNQAQEEERPDNSVSPV